MSRSPIRRPVLMLVAAAAAVLGMLGLTGVFAQTTSTATASDNHYETGEFVEQPDVELQIARPQGALGCDPHGPSGPTYSSNEQQLFAHTEPAFVEGTFDFDPFYAAPELCVRNNGSEAGDVTLTVLDLEDTEVGCTQNEADVDTTCGTGEGELADELFLSMDACDALTPYYGTPDLVDMVDAPHDMDLTLEPDEFRCISMETNSLNMDEDERRAAQSDRVSWTLQFDMTVSSEDVP